MAQPPRKKPVATPDGEYATPPPDADTGNQSKVSEVQDPAITGDAGKGGRREADEAGVDEAGQISKDRGAVDLLH
jgi:hypothetical protein